jgi:NADPH-dependent glutamate synthase beta subunit-like oxidoreductase
VLVEIVRTEWKRAFEELEAQRGDPRRYRRLRAAVEAVTDALRAQVGQTFTLEQLAEAYESVERWGREAVGDYAPYDGWARDLALVEDAAFHLYERGAVDFEP